MHRFGRVRQLPRSTRVLSVLFVAALAVAGCGGGGDDTAAPADTLGPTAPDSPTADDVKALDAVTVTGDFGPQPEVKFDTPFTVSTITTRLVSDGDGAALEMGQQLTVNAVAFLGADGTELFTTWEPPQTEQFQLGSAQFGVLTEALTGAHVGARVLVANPTEDESGPVTVVTLFEIVDARNVASRAEGETITPEPGLPTVTLAADGEPSITIPPDFAAPTELVVQPLIKGSGPVVAEENTVIVHYTGWLTNGTQFDSSWASGSPATFPLNRVIPGWTQGLAGQTVGSQVLLVVPPDLAYGDQDQGIIPPNSTLIFVVDILDAG